MNVKQLLIKSAVPAIVGAIVLSSGVLPSLASFTATSTVPTNCTSSYGYDAGYGYGYGYESTTCTTPSNGGGFIGGGSAYVPDNGPSSNGNSNGSNGNSNGNNGNSNGVDDIDTPIDSGLGNGSMTDMGTAIDGDICDASGKNFDSESKAAYLFACVNNITTKRDIDNSIFYGMLIRKEMAKMISNYAMNVMDLQPDLTKSCTFGDIVGEDAEMKKYITLSCQLGLMGYMGDGMTQASNFNPNELVTRDQFATLFARMLYGNKYSSSANSANWADASLQALKANGLLKVITPGMVEIRGYVWIVFDRASNM